MANQVKGLFRDGIDPTEENALNLSYPIIRGLFFYAFCQPEGAEKSTNRFYLE